MIVSNVTFGPAWTTEANLQTLNLAWRNSLKAFFYVQKKAFEFKLLCCCLLQTLLANSLLWILTCHCAQLSSTGKNWTNREEYKNRSIRNAHIYSCDTVRYKTSFCAPIPRHTKHMVWMMSGLLQSQWPLYGTLEPETWPYHTNICKIWHLCRAVFVRLYQITLQLGNFTEFFRHSL